MHMPKSVAGKGNRIVPIGFLIRIYPESCGEDGIKCGPLLVGKKVE